MPNGFIENIEGAYRALETILDETKKDVLNRCGSFSNAKKRRIFEVESLVRKGGPIDKYILNKLLILPANTVFQGRVPIPLGKGYLAKVSYENFVRNLGRTLYSLHVWNTLITNFEESNVQVLLNYGITKENGFLVPQHKAIGVKLENGNVKVDPEGDGWIITEDMTENGTYHVRDIEPHHFVSLANSAEFFKFYRKHIDALLKLYYHPNLDVKIYQHGKPDNPIEPISRMLLLKENGNVGKIIIGDLNNLEFKIK